MRPVELYTIAQGDLVWRYTNSIGPVRIGDDVYTAMPGLDRDDVGAGVEDLELRVAANCPVVRRHRNSPPGVTATVTIHWYDLDDPSSLRVIYKGRLQAIAINADGGRASLKLHSYLASFEQELPADSFSPRCQAFLFDAKCKVDPTAWRHEDTVAEVDGSRIRVTGLAARGVGWALPGYVAYGTSDFRQVLQQNGDWLTLIMPFYDPIVGKTVVVHAGCDGAITTCQDKFNNADNFRGCPYVPTKNIFETGLK